MSTLSLPFGSFLLLFCHWSVVDFIFRLLFCGFNWDFSLLVWFCSLCGKCERELLFCSKASIFLKENTLLQSAPLEVGAVCKWNFCLSKLWEVTTLLMHIPMTHHDSFSFWALSQDKVQPSWWCSFLVMSWTRCSFGWLCVVEGAYDWPGNPKFKGVTQLQRVSPL